MGEPYIDNDLNRHIHNLGEGEPPVMHCRGLGCGAEFDHNMENGTEAAFYQEWLEDLSEHDSIQSQLPTSCPICAPGDFYDDSDARIDAMKEDGWAE